MSRTVAIVQARIGSSRLPGKVLAEIGGSPLLAWVLTAAGAIAGVDEVILATTTHPQDRSLLALADTLGAIGFAGSEQDVLDRYFQAAKQFEADAVMRITADCPFLDPSISRKVLEQFLQGNVDYVSNCHPCTYPDGLDTEVFSFQTLERTWKEAQLPSEREHVTPYIWKHPELFRQGSVEHSVDFSKLRWSIDEPEDLEFARAVCARLAPAAPPYSMEQILGVLRKSPELGEINAMHTRNENYYKSLEQDQKALAD